MFTNLQIGKSGLDTFQKKLDMISNNIANVQTTGYKREEVNFEDLIYATMDHRGVPLSKNGKERELAIGSGSRAKDAQRTFKQGDLKESSSPLHLAIEGEGFFGVRDQAEKLYLTRDGSFSLNQDGYLVDGQGNKLELDSNKSLSKWSPDEIQIDDEGNITTSDSTKIGQITLYNVQDKSLLEDAGNNYYRAADETTLVGSKDGSALGEIKQGFLEQSNVDIGKEMVEMLVTQRAYQINTKSINTADEMWSMINNIRR